MEPALSHLLDESLVTLELQATEREAAIRELAGLLDRAGKLADVDEYVAAVMAREALGTTAVGMGVAIPHGKTAAVREAAVAFGRSRDGVDFAAPDGQPVDLVFLIAAPEGAHDLHLQALARLARRLMHDEVRAALRQARTAGEVVRALVLSGYIAYSIADRPGIAPGMVGGMLASKVGAGFLGGIASGFLAGYLAAWLVRSIRLPRTLEGLKPVLIVPVVATGVTGLLMIYVIGSPLQAIMNGLTNWLQGLSGGNAVLLGLILGAMMAFDMGGPVNKAAYTFATGLLASQVYTPMAAVMAAGMTPPLGLALATWLAPKKFTPEEREAGKAAAVLGISFITEGAIPFAAADPLRVIPSIMAGSAVTGALSMAFGATLRAPHGGIFVLPIPGVVGNLGLYALSILIGSVITAAVVVALKQPVARAGEARPDVPAAPAM